MKVDIYDMNLKQIDSNVSVLREIKDDILLDRKGKNRFEFSNKWQREYFHMGHIDSVTGYLKGNGGNISAILKMSEN